MKKILSILMLAALCANAQTTFTNGVKISALPQVSSISGTEIVVLNQSGTTKSATVNQLIAADVALINTVTNGLTALVATNGLKDTATTNGLAAMIATNGVNDLNTSNALQSLISANTAKDTATTNGLAAMIATATAQNVATSNSIAATANAAAAAAIAPLSGNAITNGGSGTVTNLFYGVKDLGTVDGSATLTVNLAAASLQTVNFTNRNGSQLALSNIAPGQNVTLICKNSANANYGTYYPANVVQISSGGYYVVVPSGKWAAFNFTVVGTNVICSASAQQN